MDNNTLIKLLCAESVIPAARNHNDYKTALQHTASPSIILLFGDIITLSGLLEQAVSHKKRLLVHLDLLSGIGKDDAGVKFLARMGVTGLITTKAHLCKVAREEGMIVIQRMFLMDSEALKTGINLARRFKPDAVEVLPVSAPAWAIQKLATETGLPVLAGGMVHSDADIQLALDNGANAVSTSNMELWR